MTEPEKCPTCLATVKQPQAYLTTAMRKCPDLWHKGTAPAEGDDERRRVIDKYLDGDPLTPLVAAAAEIAAEGAEQFVVKFWKENGHKTLQYQELVAMCEAYAASLREQLAQENKRGFAMSAELEMLREQLAQANEGLAWFADCVIRERGGTPDPGGWIRRAFEMADARQKENERLREALREVYNAYCADQAESADFIWDAWAEKAQQALAGKES